MKKFIAALLATTFLALGSAFVDAKASSVFDATNVPQTYSQLGETCNAANKGARATITDGPTTPAWGLAVTAGGGSSTVAIYCDGTTWRVYAGGTGISPPIPPTPSAVLPAPKTTVGDYATGCTTGTPAVQDGKHACLRFNDTFTSNTLSTGPTGSWSEGHSICNNGGLGGTGQNCAFGPGGDVGLSYPFSAWCFNGQNGCQRVAFYDYPYGYSNNLANAGNMLSKNADGVLSLGLVKNNFLNNNPAYCSGANCNSTYQDWIGGGLTLGGLTCPTSNRGCYPANVANTAALIPYTGGMVQWRMKLDDGIRYGAYPIMECGPVGGNAKSNAVDGVNANFEWGYTNGGSNPMGTHYGVSMGNRANGQFTLTTGDDGVGTGDVRNWHTYAAEWTGTQWNYYADGIRITGPSTPVSYPSGNGLTGFACSFTHGAAQQMYGGWRTVPDGVHNGPFSMQISNVQVYKKPGT